MVREYPTETRLKSQLANDAKPTIGEKSTEEKSYRMDRSDAEE